MSPFTSAPHLTNPWTTSTSSWRPELSSPRDALPHQRDPSQYPDPQLSSPKLNVAGLPSEHDQGPRDPTSTQYGTNSGTNTPTNSPTSTQAYRPHGLPRTSHDLISVNRMPPTTTTTSRFADGSCTPTAPSPISGPYASPSPYSNISAYPTTADHPYAYTPGHGQRRLSQPAGHANLLTSTVEAESLSDRQPQCNSLAELHHRPMSVADERRSFQEALASQGVLPAGEETPRNIYGPAHSCGRGSADSYGFPSRHSSSSSLYRLSGYYAGSVDSSVSDYSATGSDIESLSGRALAQTHGLYATPGLQAPRSMMGSFSSKSLNDVSKKHKCRVCGKRFTRPSSLQTHIYSHTGEKPFVCKFEGCSRQFSVVSNLRRHCKIHQALSPSETGSEDHHSG